MGKFNKVGPSQAAVYGVDNATKFVANYLGNKGLRMGSENRGSKKYDWN